ncbi:MAG TPA: cupin domain-containing protein [Steroidobacteraceae bacterium]|jgi:anti-sigma factor ChrR (cupin superfamily)|nr:cupin domain-containing protein [Steroidobacteraceae bacterium]
MALAINADRRAVALVDAGSLPWLPSPEGGVERRMLERIGDEVALATTLVRYAPGSSFPPHCHALGEEFLVLEGTFSDESGDFAAGTYVRNPRGSRHAPFSATGCVILVKLRQMLDDEPEFVRVTPPQRAWASAAHGLSRATLYANARSEVLLLRLEPGATLPPRATPGGEEIFVVEGSIELLTLPARVLQSWTWRRSAEPAQSGMRSTTGALLWIKRGHL